MTAIQNKAFLQVARKAAERAGKILMEHWGRPELLDVDLKGENDYVTRADRLAEEAVHEEIEKNFPDHEFLGEETGSRGTGTARWIVDPLDGTANFVHGYPAFSVSLGVELDGEVVVGVVYDPLREDWYHAITGEGAFCNGGRVQISAARDLKQALLATGFPFRWHEHLDDYLKCFRSLFLSCAGMRRMGSAALDLAWVASGKVDGFWELDLSPWDKAAGIVLVREAGGFLSDFDGGGRYLYEGDIIAGAESLVKEIQAAVGPVFEGRLRS